MLRAVGVAVVLISSLQAVSIPHYSLIANTIQMVISNDVDTVRLEERAVRPGDTIMGRTCIHAPSLAHELTRIVWPARARFLPAVLPFYRT